jgi:hypothetical protein
MLPDFIRGILREREPFTAHDDAVYEWALHVDVRYGGSVRILDALPRLTDALELQPGATYTFVVKPFLYDLPRIFTANNPPPGIGAAGTQVWWERPLWWGGIVRELAWHTPADLPVLASHLDPARTWTVLETPAGMMLDTPDPDRRIGDIVVWDELRWFKPLAILPG